MTAFLSVLYVLSALLPIVGLVRLARLASSEAAPVRAAPTLPDGSNGSRGQLNAAAGALVTIIINKPRTVVVDLLWIGSGLVSGAVGGVWSLFI